MEHFESFLRAQAIACVGHLDAMLYLQAPSTATPQSLSNIVNEVRKNRSALDSLGGIGNEQCIIRIVV